METFLFFRVENARAPISVRTPSRTSFIPTMRTACGMEKKLRSRKREKLAVINPVAPAAPNDLTGQLQGGETRFEVLCKVDSPSHGVKLFRRCRFCSPCRSTLGKRSKRSPAAARPAEPWGIRPLLGIVPPTRPQQKSEALSHRLMKRAGAVQA